MGDIRSPKPVKLFVGMLSPDPSLFAACSEVISGEFGPPDYESAALPWGRADYYRKEMGPGILRKFIFLERLIAPDMLPDIKILTNRIERDFSTATGPAGSRRINLDPGYLTEAKVVLATTKDFSHRIYIGKGIYAEVTLRYSTKERIFTALEHTYPDYRTDAYRTLFTAARDILRAEMSRRDSGRRE